MIIVYVKLELSLNLGMQDLFESNQLAPPEGVDLQAYIGISSKVGH